jgi:hypothetical protein
MKNLSTKNKDKIVFNYGDKAYKLKCESEASREEWFSAMNKELKSSKSKEDNREKTYDGILEVELKKKVIEDFFNLPKIQEGQYYIIKITEEAILKEGNFPKKPKK